MKRKELFITDTDNRDTNTTVLLLKGDHGDLYEVEVDPIDLFINAMENAGIEQQIGIDDLIYNIDKVLDKED